VQRLFSEIRVVVSLEHDKQIINLRQALETLCAGIPTPQISLRIDPAVDVNSPALAHTIFRSVQEAISNAVRHSGAEVVRVDISRTNDGLTLAISDNGKGMRKTESVKSGTGLRGICERVEEHGGSFATGNRPDGGFGLQIWLPQSNLVV
jgi:two-component system, NarL family, sensor histidine kinase DesK